MKKLTQQQKDDYLEFDAGYCPLCNDDRLSLGELKHPSNILITQKNTCRACGAEWLEQYAMNDVILTKEGSDL